MGYTVRAVLIICIVGLVSFFIAQIVIPDKNAVTDKDLAAKPRKERPAKPKAAEAIPVVTVDGTPVENPIIPHEPEPLLDIAAPKPAELVLRPEVKRDTAVKKTPLQTASTQKNETGRDSVVQKAPVQTASTQSPPAQATSTPKPGARRDSVAQKAPVQMASTQSPPAQATSTPKPAAAATVTAAQTSTGLKLEKAVLCSDLENRVPKGVSDRFSKDQKHIYYFTHVTGARDTTAAVMHKWYHEGKLVQTSILRIRSSNWRTHSKRSIINAPEMVGSWRVEVVEPATGKVMETAAFVIE